MKLDLWLYRNFGAPLAQMGLSLLAPLLPQKLKSIVHLKNEPLPDIPARLKAPFWIHASSGEIEYAKPIIRNLKARFPDIPILVTFSSVSALKLFSDTPEIDFHHVIPWENSKLIQEFLLAFQPRCLLIARTDVWPILIEQVSLNKIPSLLFSATLSKKSSRVRGLGQNLAKFAFGNLTDIYCVSKIDHEVFLSLNVPTPITISGDTRFDQVMHRIRNARPLKTELRPPTARNILVAGSTWPEDDSILQEILFRNPEIRCVWAPHEIEESNLSAIEKNIGKVGITVERYSRASTWTQARVLLIDQVGLLADLYAWGDVAFVGGSFREKVHSVMEPLASMKPVIVGPFYENNREAQEFSEIKFQIKSSQLSTQDPLRLVTRVLTPKQFSHVLQSFAQLTDSARADLGNILTRELRKKLGATAQVLEWVQKKCHVSTSRDQGLL